MLNSYRVAVLLMIIFGVAGIQAARYQDDAPSAECKRKLPVEESIATNTSGMLTTPNTATALQTPPASAALAVKTVSVDGSVR